jgi:hypothetical protein
MFVTVRHFNPSLIFVNKDGANLLGVLRGCITL